MKFSAWVKQEGGPAAVGKLLGCTNAAVRVWLRGDHTPTARMVYKIFKVSKGQVTCEQVIKEVLRLK